MSAILVKPLTFGVQSSQSGTNTPASNLNLDYPNMVWRSTSTTGAYVVIDCGGQSWDYLALVGVNMLAADSVRFRGAWTVGETTSSPIFDTTLSVTGTANTDKNLVTYSGPERQTRYLRLDFTFSSNPASYVEMQRIVVGKAVTADGMDVGADMNFEDTSRITDYRGIQIVDTFDVKQSWKFTLSNIKKDVMNTTYRTFLKEAAGKAVLFVPDSVNGSHNQESVFGRVLGQTNASLESSDQYKLNLYIREV